MTTFEKIVFFGLFVLQIILLKDPHHSIYVADILIIAFTCALVVLIWRFFRWLGEVIIKVCGF